MKRLALFILASFFFQSTAQAAVPDIEREALVAFYNSTNGVEWNGNTNWQIGDPCTNDWYGVTCDENENITEIILGINNLRGPIPPEIGNLPDLATLNLSNNRLNGSIPPEIGNLSNLYALNLLKNGLQESIPSEIGNLTNLRFLNLSENKLTGSIPATLGNLTNLRDLILFTNSLSGSIPAELGNQNNLTNLKMMDNQLSGPIPVEFGKLIKLQTLLLYNNRLNGAIPSELGKLTNLKRLELHRNRLSGSIPPEFGNLKKMEWLLLSFNGLSGSIPPELGSLTGMYRLELNDNQLGGTIPPEFGNLIKLSNLHLDDNQLGGSIPPELGNMERLSNLYLQRNQLNGPIPPEFGNLARLDELILNNNQLSGSIPAELGKISSLGKLILNDNRLSGLIPAEIGNVFISKLNLSSNRLSGRVPSTFLSFRHLMNVRGCCLTLSWNALYTDNLELEAFLDYQHESEWSATQTVAPENVSVASVDELSVTLSWEPIGYSTGEGGYRVWYGTTAGGPYMNAGITADKGIASHTIAGPDPGEIYYYVVTTETNSHNDNLNAVTSERSDEVFIQNVSPAWPAGIKATDGDYLNSVRVTFNPYEGATVYRVFRCLDAGPTCGSPVGYSESGSFDDKNVVAGTIYYYRVRACVENICTGFSAADTGFASIQLPQPTGILASSGTYSNRVQINWNSVDGATNYRVFRCLDTNQTCGSPIGFPTDNSFNDAKGEIAIVYYYRIKACTSQNCSRFSVARTGFRSDTPAIDNDMDNVLMSPDQQVSIPTLSTWGRWLLILMTMGFGMLLAKRVQLRRRV